jgi:hypothetical protein
MLTKSRSAAHRVNVAKLLQLLRRKAVHPVALVSFERRLHTPHALPQPPLSEPKHSLYEPCRCALFHSPTQRQDRRGKGYVSLALLK